MEDIRASFGYMTAEGIRRLRAGQVRKTPGFDGEYGVISLFDPDETENPWGQMDFFEMIGASDNREERDKVRRRRRGKTPGKKAEGSRRLFLPAMS